MAATALVAAAVCVPGVGAVQREGKPGPGGGGPGPKGGQSSGTPNRNVPGAPVGAPPGGTSGSVVWPSGSPAPHSAYDLGFREGARRGEQDGRGGRAFAYDAAGVARSADLNYNQQLGNRDAFRTDFRRGFVAGYRNGYDRIKGRRVPPGYQEPAVARGYSEGYERGLDDGKDHDRYDPVRHSDYREAEQGFKREYGSKDAYRNNYRTGFRQGYEDGYREGARRR